MKSRVVKYDSHNWATEICVISTNKETGEKVETWRTEGFYGDNVAWAFGAAIMKGYPEKEALKVGQVLDDAIASIMDESSKACSVVKAIMASKALREKNLKIRKSAKKAQTKKLTASTSKKAVVKEGVKLPTTKAKTTTKTKNS